MRQTRSDPHDQLVQLLARAQSRIEGEINQIMKSEDGLSSYHWRVMQELSRKTGKTMGDVQRATAINDSTLTKTVDRLVSKNFVFRRSDDHDRRKVVIFLSERGGALVKNISKRIQVKQNEIFPALSGDQIKNVESFLIELGRA